MEGSRVEWRLWGLGEQGPGLEGGVCALPELQLITQAMHTHRPSAAASSGFSRKLKILIFTCILDFSVLATN